MHKVLKYIRQQLLSFLDITHLPTVCQLNVDRSTIKKYLEIVVLKEEYTFILIYHTQSIWLEI